MFLALVAVALVAMPVLAQTRPEADLLVLAPSSMADVLPRVVDGWTSRGRATPALSFDATSRIAPQADGNPTVSVFVSADRAWMRWLEDRGRVDPARVREVARNRLVIVTPAADRSVHGPDDLRAVGRIALAGEDVPAGRYARSALEARGVWAEVEGSVVRGGSVRGALEWVARGEAGAGIVYRTDAVSEPRVRIAHTFPPADHPAIGYYAAPLEGAPEPAAAFVDFLASPEAAAVFAEEGFTEGDAAPEQSADRPVTSAAPSIGSAIRLSLIVALVATLVGLVPAVAIGWLLARRDFPGKTLLSTLVMAPLVIPPVVTGFLLLSAFGANTPLGRLLAGLGVPVPFTLVGASLAAFVVGLPLYVISIRGAFEAVDPFYEQLSWTLGSPPRKTFFRISLPLALPGIAAGAVLAFARALGEFGATVVLAGNVEGSTRTIALAVYTLLESPSGQGAIWALILASVAISLVALVGFEALTRRQKARLERRHVR